MSSPDGGFLGEPDTGPGPAGRRPPNWKAVVYAAAAVALLSVGSVIGSAHTRSGAHTATAEAVVTVTAAPPPASSAPTATVTATVNAPTPTVEDASPPLALLAQGTGAGHTPAFITTVITFEVAWTYDCAPTRPVPEFIATLYRNGDNVGLVASHIGRSGQGVNGLPNGQGTFSVAVAAPAGCRWTIAVINWPTPYYP